MIILYIFLANILIQIPNVIGILYFTDRLSISNIALINLCAIPISFVASCLFVLYYMKGISAFSYPILVLMNVGATLFVGFIVGIFILKNQTFSVHDFIGFGLISIGALVIIFKKTLA
jgi:hypothetical protein